MSKKVIALATLGVVALVAIAVAVAWLFPVFKVNSVEFTGAVRTDTDIAEDVSGINVGDNLLRVDVAGAAQSIADLPWVKAVTVNRNPPSTVEIELTEREAVVFVNRADGDHIIDSEGLPIIIGEPPFGTVEVTGTSEDDPDVLPAVIDIVNTLSDHDPALKDAVASINAPDQFDVMLRLADGREIYWGSSEDNHAKAVAMSTVIKREGQQWNISSPSMVTVR